MRATRDARLLFLVSNDHGELGNAMYMLEGQELARRSALLLPPRLFAMNERALPGRVQPYRAIEDVLDAVDAVEPDVVFLFSGYLYAYDSLLSVECLEKLVHALRVRGCHVVTSDPYLGLLSEPATIPEITGAHESFLEAARVIEDAIHFYPVPCDHLAYSRDRLNVSVFNPAYLRRQEPGFHANTAMLCREFNLDEAKPFWLFTISSTDFALQTRLHGTTNFIDLLAGTLDHALKAGRQPFLIGPRDCLDAISSRMYAPAGVALLSFCSHDLFVSLLLDAECAFYWNIFSNSMFLRFANGLPTFFFDRGHLGRVDRLYTLGIENYFRGWRPVCLDCWRNVSMPVLAIIQAVSRPEVEQVQRHVRSAPTPEQTLSLILQGPLNAPSWRSACHPN